MTRPAVLLELDTGKDTTFATDISAYLVGTGSSISINRGVNKNYQYETSSLSLNLNVISRDFVPTDNSIYLDGIDSFTGYISQGTELRVKVDGTVLFQGFITNYTFEYAAREAESILNIEAEDISVLASNYTDIKAGFSTSIDVDNALSTVLDLIPDVSASNYSLDDSDLVLNFFYSGDLSSEDGVEAWSLLQETAAHELGGFFYISKDNKFKLKKYSNMMGSTASRTWGQGTSIMPNKAGYQFRIDELITKSKVTSRSYTGGAANEVVWSDTRGEATNDSRYVAQYEVYNVEMEYSKPVSAITTPVADTDYKLNSAADGSGTNYITSPPSPAIVVSYNFSTWVTKALASFSCRATGFYITKSQIRATPVEVPSETVSLEYAEELPSTFLGFGSLERDLPYYFETDMVKNYAKSQLKTFRYLSPRLTLSFTWGSDNGSDSAITTDMIAMELGELVRFKDTGGTEDGLFINDYYRIVGINHYMSIGELFETEVILVPSNEFRNPEKIVHDSFQRPNSSATIGTPPTGTAWTLTTAGAISIVDNKIIPDNAGVNGAYQTLSTSNQVVEAKFSNIDSDTNEQIGLIVALQDSSNLYYVIYNDASDTVLIEKHSTAGGTQTLAYKSYISSDLRVNKTIELRCIKIGDLFKVWVDGKLLIVHEDTSTVNGNNAGIIFYNTNSIYCTDFYAQAL